MTLPHADPFAAMLPAAAWRMPVAWSRLQVPGPPAAFALSGAELTAATPLARFHRRLITLLDCAADGGDRLALVDKAMPHAHFDLMLSEASDRDKPSPCDVAPSTGRALWRTGLELVRFVSDPQVMGAHHLADGALHLALNCDPDTRDRESVQAAKQFHLHLLYWNAAELAQLAGPAETPSQYGSRSRRQLLDPVGFVGARLVTALLRRLDLGLADAEVLDRDDAAVAAGRRPPGALLRLPGWSVLAEPAFEDLIRRLHQRLTDTASLLRAAFTGTGDAPAPWQRHPLRSRAAIEAALTRLDLPDDLVTELGGLADALRDLPSPVLARLRRGPPALRKHLLTLNPPSYALNLFAPGRNRPDTPVAAAESVYMSVQPKLFSGTGGAGLLALDGLPSVRVCRGAGHFSEAQWRRRAALQRAFALHNAERLQGLIGCGPVRRFLDCERGWV
ncbi:hypothetical protein CKO31_14575 [Thiohalocapsa halophila]|uniref:Dehydrogenase n=1 Tax=Thiohalocapsa halophila TaxID=69359 RepID=A0ABS1CJ47_9GAMM|nr:hypothetical protein [Thiohalocapsa halophila]MBK1631938.1 hypothetical protein [Thiohalocapsa halophila]